MVSDPRPYLLLLLCLTAGVGCDLFAPGPSDLDTLTERYGDLPSGTFVVDSQRGDSDKRFEGCTSYRTPGTDTAPDIIQMLDTLGIESRTVVGILRVLGLPEAQAPQEVGAGFSMDNVTAEGGTLQILEQNGKSAAGVFSFKMRGAGLPIPSSARMEGGVHVRYSDTFGGVACSSRTPSP